MEGQTMLPTPHQIRGWTGLCLDKERKKKASKSAQGVAESVFKNNLESLCTISTGPSVPLISPGPSYLGSLLQLLSASLFSTRQLIDHLPRAHTKAFPMAQGPSFASCRRPTALSAPVSTGMSLPSDALMAPWSRR